MFFGGHSVVHNYRINNQLVVCSGTTVATWGTKARTKWDHQSACSTGPVLRRFSRVCSPTCWSVTSTTSRTVLALPSTLRLLSERASKLSIYHGMRATDCLTFSLCHPRCTLGYTRCLVFGVHVLLHVRLHQPYQPFDFWRFLAPTIVTLGVSAKIYGELKTFLFNISFPDNWTVCVTL